MLGGCGCWWFGVVRCAEMRNSEGRFRSHSEAVAVGDERDVYDTTPYLSTRYGNKVILESSFIYNPFYKYILLNLWIPILNCSGIILCLEFMLCTRITVPQLPLSLPSKIR